MIFLKDLFLVLTLIPRVFYGWMRVLIRLSIDLFGYFILLSFLDKALFVLAFLQLGGTLRPWLEYSVDFLDNPETLQVSVKANLWIILLSLLVFLFSQWNQSKHRKLYICITQIFLTILVTIGFLFPNLLFTDFINPTDYRYSVFAKIFLTIHYPFTLFSLYYFFQKEPQSKQIQETLTGTS
jgi:hypothetical protein